MISGSRFFIVTVVLLLTSCQSPKMRQSAVPEILLDHKYFQISYNPDHRLPNWVSYRLYSKQLRRGVAKRRDKFFPDKQLREMKIPYSMPADFDGRTYDRGHMAPSEDFIWSQEANDETFVMSNMAPQTKKLNRGSWKTLEAKIRKWACTEEELHIITGPILSAGLPKFHSQVSIPKTFFKIVVDETEPRKAIAFVYSQEDTKVPPQERAFSVRDIEKITGLSLLSELKPQIKNQFNSSAWVETDCIQKLTSTH